MEGVSGSTGNAGEVGASRGLFRIERDRRDLPPNVVGRIESTESNWSVSGRPPHPLVSGGTAQRDGGRGERHRRSS